MPGPRTWTAGAAMAAGTFAFAGCAAAGKASVPRAEAEAVLPAPLRDLWERHGGPGAWRKHTAVRLSYRVSRPGWRGEIEVPEVAFRLRDPRRLWVRLSRGAEQIVIDLEPGRGDGDRSALAEAARSRGADPADLELGLRLLPFFLGLPLSASLGPWEFRTVVGPDGAAVAGWLEAVPRARGAPVGSTLLSADERTGLLARALYAVLFPEPDPIPRLVTFEDYADAGGVRVALRRVHREIREEEPSIGAPWVPYAPSPDGDERDEGEAWSLQEEIRDLVFLDEKAAEEACPLPAQLPSPGAPSDSGSAP